MGSMADYAESSGPTSLDGENRKLATHVWADRSPLCGSSPDAKKGSRSLGSRSLEDKQWPRLSRTHKTCFILLNRQYQQEASQTARPETRQLPWIPNRICHNGTEPAILVVIGVGVGEGRRTPGQKRGAKTGAAPILKGSLHSTGAIDRSSPEEKKIEDVAGRNPDSGDIILFLCPRLSGPSRRPLAQVTTRQPFDYGN